MSLTGQRKQLRRELRQRRRALSAQQQRIAAKAACRNLSLLPEFLTAKRIGIYLPNDGELDPRALQQRVWRQGKALYLPVLHPLRRGELLFYRYQPDQAMKPNRFGIMEPAAGEPCAPWMLDLVITPLVGFDRNGNRMGMGGGYYDRTFAFIRQGKRPRNPTLVGFAHACQEVESLPSASWDVPLATVVTDLEVLVRG